MTAPAHRSSTRPAGIGRAALTGAAAGVAGAAVMAAGEKLEQAATSRPNSFVPGRALLALLGRSPSDADRPLVANWTMHYATGALLGALRGIWSATGIRGVRADVAHTVTRLATDQTLENASGVGAPPASWPLREQLADYGDKAVYAFVTGALTDRLVRPALRSNRGVVSH